MRHFDFRRYVKDRIYTVIIACVTLVLSIMLCVAFKMPLELICVLMIMECTAYILIIAIDYYKKRHFYNELLSNLEGIDKKYLVIETAYRPGFYEGEILYNVLSETERSMAENVKQYRVGMEDFKEYVEMWIHEIKLPMASLTLMLHNYQSSYTVQAGNNDMSKDNGDKSGDTHVRQEKELLDKISTQLSRINNYIEQILYYVRSENAEKDYIINECRLSKIVNAVAIKNKDYLLENCINLEVDNLGVDIMTDSKWLEFILNQIVSNSIKYYDKEKPENIIKIAASEDKSSVVVNIYDNGIGICDADVTRVFDKSFTGQNGRNYSKATGMGLYIAKKLCDKLGHKIELESKEGEYTQVNITFYKNDFFKQAL